MQDGGISVSNHLRRAGKTWPDILLNSSARNRSKLLVSSVFMRGVWFLRRLTPEINKGVGSIMGFKIPCPNCGIRDVYEFSFDSEVRFRPQVDSDLKTWRHYLY